MKEIETVQPDFGIRIKMLRLAQDMTQQELADFCELSIDQIQKIESGRSWTTDLSFALLAAVLNVSKKSLLDYGENAEFIRSGGNTRRASRKKGALTVRHRSVDLLVPSKTGRTSK